MYVHKYSTAANPSEHLFIIPVLADLIGRKYGLAVCGVLMVLGAILKSSSYYVS